MNVKHLKTGNIYEVVMTGVIDATNNNPTHGKEMVVYRNDDGAVFVRETVEFWQRFEKEPNRCCCCGTTENLRKDGWYGYRCNSDDCVVF